MQIDPCQHSLLQLGLADAVHRADRFVRAVGGTHVVGVGFPTAGAGFPSHVALTVPAADNSCHGIDSHAAFYRTRSIWAL